MDLLLVLCFVFSTSWQWVLALNMTGCLHQKPYPLVLDARRQPKGDIYTPGFKYGKYPDHSRCDYIIKAKAGYIIKLTFVEMEIEPSRSCGRDKVTVIDGASSKGPKLGDFCGLEPPPYPVVSSTSSMRLVFRTDWLIAKKGFHARYEAILPSEICRRGWRKCRNNRCYRPEQKCNGVDDCLDGSDEEKCKRPTPAFKCGGGSVRPIELEAPDRIVGGIEARPHSWPWQADLHVGKAYPNSHICGGTLVHPQWVLTAAHCVIGHPKAKSWRVHLGSHRRFKTDKYEQIRLVELVIMYPYYVGSDILGRKLDLLNDFALLKLNAPVNLTNGVKTACLLDNDNVLTPGTKCIATGWGTTRGTGAYKALKQAELYVQPLKTCRVNRSHQICLGSRKGIRGACHGDSGGPLHCKVSGKWFVVGVASYVTRTNMIHGLCAVGGTKSVYAGTASKIKWIEHALHMFG